MSSYRRPAIEDLDIDIHFMENLDDVDTVLVDNIYYITGKHSRTAGYHIFTEEKEEVNLFGFPHADMGEFMEMEDGILLPASDSEGVWDLYSQTGRKINQFGFPHAKLWALDWVRYDECEGVNDDGFPPEGQNGVIKLGGIYYIMAQHEINAPVKNQVSIFAEDGSTVFGGPYKDLFKVFETRTKKFLMAEIEEGYIICDSAGKKLFGDLFDYNAEFVEVSGRAFVNCPDHEGYPHLFSESGFEYASEEDIEILNPLRGLLPDGYYSKVENVYSVLVQYVDSLSTHGSEDRNLALINEVTKSFYFMTEAIFLKHEEEEMKRELDKAFNTLERIVTQHPEKLMDAMNMQRWAA